MRLIFSILAIATLSSCGSLSSAQNECSSADFSKTWSCIESRVREGSAGSMNNAMGTQYMARGRYLDTLYRQGKISSEQAHVALADELAHASAAFNEQQRSGMTAFGDALQTYGQSMQTQNQSITCTTYYNTTYCR